MQNQEQSTTLPGVWATVGAGFDVITRRPWLLVIPVALDLFLWLGPRLSFGSLVGDFIAQYPVDGMLADPRPMLELVAPRLNMFSYLSVILIGVPAMMAGLSPEFTPLATSMVEITGWGQWALLLGGLTLLGLLLAAAYYGLIAMAVSRAVEDGETPPAVNIGVVFGRIGRTWGRFVALTLLFIGLALVVIVPFSLTAALVGLFSPTLAVLIVLVAPVILLWIVILLSYVPSGLALNPKGFLTTILESIRLFQANLVQAAFLLAVVVVISQIMNWLLLLADDGSWLTLVSILGHAFISTALVAAMLIFYRDRYQLMFAVE